VASASASGAAQAVTDVESPIAGPGFAGSLRLTSSLAAPLVVFLPKTYGSRKELLPFAARARELGLAAHTLVLDPPKLTLAPAKPGAPPSLPADDLPPLVAAIRAAIAVVDARVGGTPPIVLVGSDFGATLAVLVAKEEPRVRAAALLSPGPALHGVDLYRPFASLIGKPVFVGGADHDPVSSEPLGALATMAREKATKKLYPGVAHGAGSLAEASPLVRDDLAQWLVAMVRNAAEAPAASASASPPMASVAPAAPSKGAP
jgi:dienelactone hydrolase